YFASAVDEWGKRDGTPDTLAFFVSHSPRIDSIVAPHVIVLAPNCGNPAKCPPLGNITFGPDTVLVIGTHMPDVTTPCEVGQNQFVLPIKVYGHDNAADRTQPYDMGNKGAIKAWRFTLDCLDCEDYGFSGENSWREALDTANDSQVFDDVRFTVNL